MPQCSNSKTHHSLWNFGHYLDIGAWNLVILRHPCLCLCLGFSQITRITPLRFTILHLSQIFLTDALTFTAFTSNCYQSGNPNALP
jgi:hypothetical protein